MVAKKTRNIACDKRLKKSNKWLFVLDKAILENWDDYKAKLDAILKKKLKISKENSMSNLELLNKDELQDIILSSIIKCASMTLPKKKVATGSTNFKQRFDSDSIKKDLKKISRICQQCMTELDQKIDDSSREHSNI